MSTIQALKCKSGKTHAELAQETGLTNILHAIAVTTWPVVPEVVTAIACSTYWPETMALAETITL
ncbi:hypothetical protein RJ639_034086 [Escallonia herrerae]|uniref:Uncharacterized protein n=1 Tax=Escallonia herrerae TaxID=1293975 RepID=A0AA88WU72_9ASTE|nr:hypothetical protein RJ639_034086 [Escallonia herrerae]